MAKAIICGSRACCDRASVWLALDMYRKELDLTEIAEGGAKGVDRLARKWAQGAGISCRTFEADWEHGGKAAGPARNARMLDEFAADYVIAFPGGFGTADMVRRARVAGIEVVCVDH